MFVMSSGKISNAVLCCVVAASNARNPIDSANRFITRLAKQPTWRPEEVEEVRSHAMDRLRQARSPVSAA